VEQVKTLEDGSLLFFHIPQPPSLPNLHKDNNVTPEIINEIRRLRATDPVTWTAGVLAQKFNVSSK
jgi:hypothetical protein